MEDVLPDEIACIEHCHSSESFWKISQHHMLFFYSMLPTSKSVEGIFLYFTCQEIEIPIAFLPMNLLKLLKLRALKAKKASSIHPSIGKSIASRLKGDPAHLSNPGETHLEYWAQFCTLQCKRHVDIVE